MLGQPASRTIAKKLHGADIKNVIYFQVDFSNSRAKWILEKLPAFIQQVTTQGVSPANAFDKFFEHKCRSVSIEAAGLFSEDAIPVGRLGFVWTVWFLFRMA